MTVPFQLCDEGWRLYFAWLAHQVHWRDYVRHRVHCGYCSKPLKKGKR